MNDNVKKLDRPRICYLLCPENPLEVGEKFDLPNCDEYNPYYIDEKGIIRDCMNGFIGSYDVRMFFDCINGKSHIQRLPQYPDFSDTEVEALKWFHKHFGTELKAYTDGDTAVFGLYKFTLVPAILFPHLKEYIQGNSLDVNKYLKWREENNAN